MTELRQIYGIGRKKEAELKKIYNIRSVYALRKYVRKIPDIITEQQRVGLRYYDKINTKITKKEMDKHIAFITKVVPDAVVAGSYRRDEKKIGDIDIITMKDISKIVSKLRENGYIVADLIMGDSKYSGICKLQTSYRRLDIIRTTKEEFPFALLYFTGDFIQNINMRQTAKKRGYTLSQNGLKNIKTDKPVKGLKTERDIFKFLEMPYKEPHQRSNSTSG